MRRFARKNEDEVALALAGGCSIRAAAARANLHEKTIRRWLTDPEFVRRVQEARAKLFDKALAVLAGGLALAGKTLRKLLASPSDAVRLGAARALFEAALKARENLDLAAQLAELQQAMEDRDRDAAHRPAGYPPPFSRNGSG